MRIGGNPRGLRGIWGLAILAVAFAGCASLDSAERDDLRIALRGNTVYVVAAERAAAASLCTDLGQSASGSTRALARGAVDTREVSPPARCLVRLAHVIVCADGDQACVAHEERHAREGNFHR